MKSASESGGICIPSSGTHASRHRTSPGSNEREGDRTKRQAGQGGYVVRVVGKRPGGKRSPPDQNDRFPVQPYASFRDLHLEPDASRTVAEERRKKEEVYVAWLSWIAHCVH